MADENDIAAAVVSIARANRGLCTFKRAYADVPKFVALDTDNLSPSVKRPGEPMWHQLVRNIKSHDKSAGNYIHDGHLVHVPRVGYRVP